MANEEIEISELEFTEELAGDNLIPVESSTDTKATSLQILKNWLSSFFVGKTGNDTINGVKTFTSEVKRYASLGSGGTHLMYCDDSNGKGSSYITAYYTNSGLYNRLQSRNNTSNVTAWVDVVAKDDGSAVVQVGSSGASSIATYAITPPEASNGTNIATTAWVKSKICGIDYANPTAKVSEGGTWSANSTYTVPSQGYVIISSIGQAGQVKVNGIVVGQVDTSSGSGWTSPVGNVFLPVKGGDKITTTSNLKICYFYFWAI